jgi:hypothetical protein
MAKLTGWQKTGLVVGVGCLSIVGIVVVGLIIGVIWARSTVADFGDPTPRLVERTIALREQAPAAPNGSKAQGSTEKVDQPLRLSIDLEEGSFTIQPGPAGSAVRVEGTYSPDFYDLTETTEPVGEGAPRTTIRFRPKAPMWVRILAGFGSGGFDDRPEVTVLVPEGQPIDLSLRVAMGESRIDLGGLTLRDLGLDLSMGNHDVDFTKPVVEGLRRVSVSAHMGNVSIDNLGSAGAQSIDGTGSMGNLTADLGGTWPPGTDADVSFTQSMGELRLSVPSKVRLEASVTSSNPDRSERQVDENETTDPDAPRVRLRVSTSMGNSRINRY